MICKRAAFAAAVALVPRDKLVFVDEAGVNLSMARTHARSTCGRRAFAVTPFNRGSNISIIAAVREDAVMAWRPMDGAVDGERFLAFVTDALAPKLEVGDVVVLDNVRFHHMQPVRDAIEREGATVLFISPYSPELNAIEEVFSFVKGRLRQLEARSIPALIDALTTSFRAATNHLRAYVTHALWHAARSL